jgi:hypothetical protein
MSMQPTFSAVRRVAAAAAGPQLAGSRTWTALVRIGAGGALANAGWLSTMQRFVLATYTAVPSQ